MLVASHYDRWLGYSIERSRPSARQFITFLRDPFDRCVSWYHYWQSAFSGKARVQGAGPNSISAYGSTLEEFVRSYRVTLLDFLPIPDRWKDFVFIGRTEHLQEDMNVFADMAGGPRVVVGKMNQTSQHPETAGLRTIYENSHPEEMDAYRTLIGMRND